MIITSTLYHNIAMLSMSIHKVEGSSPTGSRKGAMVKWSCILPLKTRKVLDLQGLEALMKHRYAI